MARSAGGRSRPGALSLQNAARKARRRDRAHSLDRENGKTVDDAKAAVRRAIQMVEVACGMPSLMMGDSLERRRARHRLQIDPPADRRLRRHHAVQFPRHGAHVDVPVRHRLRQHVRPEAIRKSAADAHPHSRAAAGRRRPGRRLQPDSWRQNRRRRAARSIRWCGRFRLSVRRPSRSISTTTAAKHGKRVQALGGAKNHLVVMPDADHAQNRSKPSSARHSARRASAASPGACWSRSATSRGRCSILLVKRTNALRRRRRLAARH